MDKMILFFIKSYENRAVYKQLVNDLINIVKIIMSLFICLKKRWYRLKSYWQYLSFES